MSHSSVWELGNICRGRKLSRLASSGFLSLVTTDVLTVDPAQLRCSKEWQRDGHLHRKVLGHGERGLLWGEVRGRVASTTGSPRNAPKFKFSGLSQLQIRMGPTQLFCTKPGFEDPELNSGYPGSSSTHLLTHHPPPHPPTIRLPIQPSTYPPTHPPTSTTIHSPIHLPMQPPTYPPSTRPSNHPSIHLLNSAYVSTPLQTSPCATCLSYKSE